MHSVRAWASKPHAAFLMHCRYVTRHAFGHATQAVKACKQLLASSQKMYVITAAAAGVFARDHCHSSSELYLNVKLPISLAKLPVSTV